MNEKDLKTAISSELKAGTLKDSTDTDSVYWEYKWKLNDTIITVELSLNGDGIPKGNLRVIVLDLTSHGAGIKNPTPDSQEPSYPTPKEDSILYNQLSQEGAFLYRAKSGRISYIGLNICSEQRFKIVYDDLIKKFGKQDSVGFGIYDHVVYDDPVEPRRMPGDHWPSKGKPQKDTTLWKYYFHDNKSIVVLQRGKLYQSSYFIPFTHTNEALVYQVSTSYEEDLEKTRKEILKHFKPSDLITIPVSYDIISKNDDYGQPDTYIEMIVRNDPYNRKSLAETRSISSMKGKFIFEDSYKDTLMQINDVEILFDDNPIQSFGPPGLDHALGRSGSLLFQQIERGFSVRVFHKDNSIKLKEAVMQNREFSIEFIPEAIVFTDGNIFK